METNRRTIYFVPETLDDQSSLNDFHYIGKDELLRMYPKTVTEKVDMIMLNLGEKIRSWGDGYQLNLHLYEGFTKREIPKFNSLSCAMICDKMLAIDCSENEYRDSMSLLRQEVHGILAILKEYGYLRTEGNDFAPTTFFTVNGWKHLEALKALKAKNKELPQAFVAMWFDEKMKPARERIKGSIIACGYNPVLIDEKEHNKQIVPEILYEIQRSRFVVADLSGHRNGVYYEAGYAHGLGKDVILTCKKNYFKKRHFDVAQISTIVWEDEDDLYNKLSRRIEVTVGKRG